MSSISAAQLPQHKISYKDKKNLVSNFPNYPNLKNQVKNILKDKNTTVDTQHISNLDVQIDILCMRGMLLDKIKESINEEGYLSFAKDGYDLYIQWGGVLDDEVKEELSELSNKLIKKIKERINKGHLFSVKDGYNLYKQLGGVLDDEVKKELSNKLIEKINYNINEEGYLSFAKDGYDLYVQLGGVLDDEVKKELSNKLIEKINYNINKLHLSFAKDGYDLYVQLGGVLDDEVKKELSNKLIEKINYNINEEGYLSFAKDGYDLYVQLGGVLDDEVKKELSNKLIEKINYNINAKGYLSFAKDGYDLYVQLGGVLDDEVKKELSNKLIEKIKEKINRNDLTDAKNGYDLLQNLDNFSINKNLEVYFKQHRSQIMRYRDLAPQTFFDLEYIEQLTTRFPLLLQKPAIYKPLLEKNYDFIKSNFKDGHENKPGFENNGLWKLMNETILRYNDVGIFLGIQKTYFSNVTITSVNDDCVQDIINYSLEHTPNNIFTTFRIWLGVFGENIFNRKQLNSMYILSLKLGMSISDFPRNHNNILDHLEGGEVLLDIPKDRGFIQLPKPWSKEWFLEKCERIRYLNSDDIQTFLKFGTVVALGILEGSTSLENFQNYYNSQLRLMNVSNERSIVLQLGEALHVITTKQNFTILNDISNFKLGDACKEFIEEFTIGAKGKTIISLLFTKEINLMKQIQGDCSLKNISNAVYHKIQGYNKILKLYRAIPRGYRISMGLEYEVTKSISDEYGSRTQSNYKQDIEILSEYSGIAKGSDAIHEIATKPTDNPYLLILELSLLQSLDFINLNFDMKGYEKGSRSFHISVGGEYGIENNGYTNFMQNILIAANLGGINAGKSVKKVNRNFNIRDKGSDCDAVFSNEKTPVTELRSFSIDTTESFERCMVYLFDMSLGNQAIRKLTTLQENDIMNSTKKFQTIEDRKQYLLTNNLLKYKDGEYDEMGLHYAYHFFCLIQDVIVIIKDHNDNFYTNETDGYLCDNIRSAEHTHYRNNKYMFGDILDIENTNELVELIDKKTRISPPCFFIEVTPEFQNTFTFINNLYLKGVDSKGNNSSINAGAVFDCTKIQNTSGQTYYDSEPKACRKTVFDHLEEKTSIRNGRYQIQGSSDKMIVNALQEALMRYHKKIQGMTKR